jgi:hypothetical protein
MSILPIRKADRSWAKSDSEKAETFGEHLSQVFTPHSSNNHHNNDEIEKLSLENKILLYKYILKPIWTYGIQLWVCTKPSNTKVLQRFQSNLPRSIPNAPWYVSNLRLHRDLQIPFVTEEINKYSTVYHSRLIPHENTQVTELSNPLHVKRRLRPHSRERRRGITAHNSVRFSVYRRIITGWFLRTSVNPQHIYLLLHCRVDRKFAKEKKMFFLNIGICGTNKSNN